MGSVIHECICKNMYLFISAMFVPLCAMDDYSESEEESSESSCQEIWDNEDDAQIRTPGINYYHIFNEDEKIARSGKYFEPSEFWKKDIKDQNAVLERWNKSLRLGKTHFKSLYSFLNRILCASRRKTLS